MLNTQQKKGRGFTLVELILVTGLSGIILTTWTATLSQQMVDLDKRLQTARKTQQFNQLGFWLSQELERARDSGEYAWQWQQHCLLYSEEGGVRLHQGMLQWRGGTRQCHSPGWVSLGDIADYLMTDFQVSEGGKDHGNGHLRLSAVIEGQTVEWEYRFNGELHFVP